MNAVLFNTCSLALKANRDLTVHGIAGAKGGASG